MKTGTLIQRMFWHCVDTSEFVRAAGGLTNFWIVLAAFIIGFAAIIFVGNVVLLCLCLLVVILLTGWWLVRMYGDNEPAFMGYPEVELEQEPQHHITPLGSPFDQDEDD